MDEKPPGKYNAPDLEVIFLVWYTALGYILIIRRYICLSSVDYIPVLFAQLQS